MKAKTKPTDDSYPCDHNDGNPNHTFEIASGNGDSNCFRVRPSYAKRLVKKNPSLCNDCVYNKNN